MAGESSSMSLEMGGAEDEFSTNSVMASEGRSSSTTHDHWSTSTPCSYCMRHGASFVDPPSGSLYLCSFDVTEDLLFHPQVAMKLNGVGPRGVARRKTFSVPMLSLKEGRVKEPARKECRNCRAAASSSNLSIMNAPIHIIPPREEPGGRQNVRVVVPDGMRSWYITLPPRSQESGVQRRRRACGDCNVNGQQHLVRIPGGCPATETMVIPTKQVLLHMLDRLPLEMHAYLLSQREMNVKWTPMEFRNEMISQPAGGGSGTGTGTDSAAGLSSENLEGGFYEGFITYFKTRSQWSGRRKVYLGAFDPEQMCVYIGLWKSKEEAAIATGLAAMLSRVTAAPAQTVVSTA